MDVEWRDHIRELIPIRHLSNWNSRALLVLIELTNEELVILLADSTSDSIFLPPSHPLAMFSLILCDLTFSLFSLVMFYFLTA